MSIVCICGYFSASVIGDVLPLYYLVHVHRFSFLKTIIHIAQYSFLLEGALTLRDIQLLK